MSLNEYKRKRDFKKTSEPNGEEAIHPPGQQFVIQKHAASRLHYDFRLELDGVLLSWAVPKGPSLDPAVKSLAVQTEDHPLSYASFEGIIPADQYGGGTVMVWDHGTWECDGNAASDYRKGKLSFELFGEKLQGGWTLVRMRGKRNEDGKNWLLIKRDDEQARDGDDHDITSRLPTSVLTGRSLKQIAADADKVYGKDDGSRGSNRKSAKQPKESNGKRKTASGASESKQTSGLESISQLANAKKKPQPSELEPQLPSLVRSIPDSDNWLHELKFDGYRLIAFINDGNVRFMTRRGHDWTRKFKSIGRALGKLGLKNAVLDGEVVALNDDGSWDFQLLQNSLKKGSEKSLVYYCFDLPHCEGFDLTRTPLLQRKLLLSSVLLSGDSSNQGVIRYSDHVQGKGQRVIEHACRMVMEGVVSKRANGLYQQGRSKQWLKVKCLKRQEFVIGGFSEASGSRIGFGALLLGYFDDKKELIFCGRVGTGFTSDSLRQIKRELNSRIRKTSPFDSRVPTDQRRGVTWVKPELVCEVEFAQWTQAGMLRTPSFRGLREDKPAEDVVREQTASRAGLRTPVRNQSSNSGKSPSKTSSKTTVAMKGTARGGSKSQKDTSVAGVHLTHPDRVLFPDQGLTKMDLALFYQSIADWILPYVVERPLSLVRCPQGRAQKCFYQKHLTDSMPDAIDGVMIEEKSSKATYPVIHDLAGLISFVQMGVLEIHPWPARVDRLDRPDQVVLDLDPGEGVQWKEVIAAASQIRQRLDDLNLTSFVRTSGGKGLHVVVPIDRRTDWEPFYEFTEALALSLVKEQPKKFVATMSKSKRQGKIFVDYFRNRRGATAIASYCIRARQNAPVATPVSWEELPKLKSATEFTVANLPKRLEKIKSDAWEGFFDIRQSLTKSVIKKVQQQ
jgi:bifunctional non-homologous end joining protein LigD